MTFSPQEKGFRNLGFAAGRNRSFFIRTNLFRNRKVEVCSSSPKPRKSLAEKPLTSSIAHLS
jgi:hypothetical protein